jgi:hypothetical protein
MEIKKPGDSPDKLSTVILLKKKAKKKKKLVKSLNLLQKNILDP